MPRIDDLGHIEPDKFQLLLITRDYLIFMDALNFRDLQLPKRVQQATHLCVPLTSVLKYSLSSIAVKDRRFTFITVLYLDQELRQRIDRQKQKKQLDMDYVEQIEQVTSINGVPQNLKKSNLHKIYEHSLSQVTPVYPAMQRQTARGFISHAVAKRSTKKKFVMMGPQILNLKDPELQRCDDRKLAYELPKQPKAKRGLFH